MSPTTNPEMHTAEHLLNQAMVRLVGCGRCFTAHIGKKKSKCDYRLERPPDKDRLREVEERVNREIAADLPVTEEFVDRETAARDFDLGRLPEAAGDRVRIVRIGDFDACPCIGPHARRTGELGRFRITTTSFEDGIFRLRFKLDRPAA